MQIWAAERMMRASRWNRDLAIGIVVACAGFWGSARGADQVVVGSSRLAPLPGLVAAPRLLPGIGRWQIAHRYPSCEVYAVAWSPDGKRLAYSDLSYVRICDSQTFETQAILVGHTSRVVSIDWNRTNNWIASAGYDGRVRIWSADGAPLKELDPHSGELHAIAWSPDGSRLASAGNDGRVRIWRSDGKAGPIINASEAPVECVAWCPDGKRLVSGDDKSLVKIWNADGSAGPVCQGHLAHVTEVAWSPDGKRIASSTWGYKPPSTEEYFADVRMWNADGSAAGVLAGASANYGICWSPDSQHLAVISEGGQIRIAAPNANLESTRPLGQTVLSGCPLAWSPDGKEIAAGGTGSICVLRLSDGSTRRSPSQAATGPPTAPPPAGLPNLNLNKWLVRMAADERWQIWNADGSPGPTMPDDVTLANITLLAWNPARDQIAFIESGVRLRLWSVGSASTKVIREFPESITGLVWSPNGETLAASDQSTVRFVRSDGTPVFERKIDGQASVRGPGEPSSTVRFTANGETVAVVERNQVVLLRRDGTLLKTVTFDPPVDNLQGNWFWWSSDGVRMTTLRKQGEKGGNLMTRDLETGDARKLSEFPDEIDSADCSPDGKRLLTGYNGGDWELQHLDQSDAPTLSARGHLNGTILGAVFSPDGRRFATGGWDAMIRVWSLEGVCLQSLSGHGMPIQSLRWSADGKRLLSRSRDRSMRVWSVATGRPELIFTALADGTWLILTGDGRLIGGSRDGIARTFLFLVEQATGAMEIVGYAEFLKRAHPTIR